jgi:hypothetical protein
MRVLKGGPIEMKQMGSADPPLAVQCAFTLAVIANFTPPAWVVYSLLLPLFLLLLSGLNMFVLPYAAKWSGERRAGA